MDLEIVVPVEDMTDLGGVGVQPPVGPDGEPQLPGPTPGLPGQVPGDTQPHNSIWPAIYPELLKLVREHTSTIVFVNNRRGSERLAKRLNEMNAEELYDAELAEEEKANGPPPKPDPDAPPEPPDAKPPVPLDRYPEIARAHHGSLAREEREVVEEMLKRGDLPCLVATSSLELGIDMGAVDLVIQVESPKSVARGIQRIGRAGHELGAVSKGRIFPKFRSDLLECAVVAKRMRSGEIEETVIPQNPLDVLAQHIVSIVADPESEWTVDDIESVVTGTDPYKELSREQLENVLDMLDGRYPSERFAELRPRIVWDRTAGTVRGRKGARQLAVTNAGTIPDRGLYGVHLPDGRRVGELDEEMVYEARAGQVFLLGASSWRIEEITRDRVIVTPAPGVPGAVPFWRGEGVGRPVELGRAIGEFSREAVNKEPEQLAEEYDLDQLAARNLVDYLREQQAATRVVPSDQTIVVERFRDEIGDWRLCVLSPFGGRVHAAWGLALAARIRDEYELEADAIWSDDGIVVHLPDADEAPSPDLVLLDADEIEDLVVGELSGSALFGARFREAAGRSLLIPRAYPGKRTPLWQQRLKSQSLLEVAKDFPRFPVTLETYREVLRDVLDLPALAEILRDLKSRRISLVEVETQTASPFASSLLFDYVATYMYEGDTPNAERRAAALALDRDLLRELLGQEELRELIDPAALEDVENSLQHRIDQAKAVDRDQLQQILRRLGDLTSEECEERTADGYSAASMLQKLQAERRIVEVRIAGEARWIAAEDGALYRDALGVPVPSGLPDSFLEPVPDPMEVLMRRYARTHIPFPTAQPQRRFGVDPSAALKALEAKGELIRGELLPGGSEREWCDPDVLRRLRRASLAVLRKEVEATDPSELARFLSSWQNVDAYRPAGAGPDRLREALVPLQGVALTPETWERDVLPRRLGTYSPVWLDELATGGEIVWIGAGATGRTGRVAFYFREDVRIAGPPPANVKLDRPEGEIQDEIRELLGNGPAFWVDLVADLLKEGRSREELHNALWDLAWSGEVTNDAVAPLRAPRLKASESASARRGRRFSARRNATGQAVAGRWSLTASLFRNEPAGGTEAPRAGRADARALRDRHPRDRARRGDPRRVLLSIWGALEPRGARHRPPRLLRRGTGRRAVRARRRGRAAALAASRRRGVHDPRRHRPGAALRREPEVAAPGRDRRGALGPRRPPAEPRRRRLRPAPQRPARHLHRARRQGPAAARRHPGAGAGERAQRDRRRGARAQAPAPRPRADRRRVDRRPRARGLAGRGRVRAPAAAVGGIGVARPYAAPGRWKSASKLARMAPASIPIPARSARSLLRRRSWSTPAVSRGLSGRAPAPSGTTWSRPPSARPGLSGTRRSWSRAPVSRSRMS